MSYHTEKEEEKKINHQKKKKKGRGKHLSMHQLHTDVQKIRLMPLSPTTSPWEGGGPHNPDRPNVAKGKPHRARFTISC